jgi:hypothetical protein
MNQLNLFEKEIAIQRATDHQEKRLPGWNERALKMLMYFSRITDDFITEDFRYWAEKNGLEEPGEPRAYGGIVLKASRMGMIIPTGHFRNMKNPKSHENPKRVWRRK